MLNRWHAEDREVILHQLGTDPLRGLTPAESTRRLREHGPNELPAQGRSSAGALLLRKFGDPMIVTLLAAAALAGYLGAWAECLAVTAVAVLNGLLGFFQEQQADRAPAALARLSAPSARVIRGGKPFRIPSAELVPGDLAEVVEGDRVPADMRLFSAERLFIDESALTGEPLPVTKDPALVLPEGTALADRMNMLFAGTAVTEGSGTAIVIATGPRTEVGRIARLLGEAERGPTPLQQRLAELGQALALACLLLGAAVFTAGRLQHQPTATLLLAVVGLAVASIPEGLPAVVTIVMKAGVRRLARCGVLVRSLPAVETLGSVTVVATDKTGTLTRNEMTVRELALEGAHLEVTGTGYSPKGAILRGRRPADPGAWETLGAALRICALCSSARLVQVEGSGWQVVGDPTEGALLTLAAKGGIWQDEARREHPALGVFPFTAERRLMTVVVPGRGGRPMALTKGSPDVVLARCLHQRTASGVRPLSPADRERILAGGEEMAGRALRVLGLAYREDAAGVESRTVERSMVWVGLVGMFDPPRPEIHAAFEDCRAAGIRPVIITGDQKLTALALAREIGALRPGDEAISGEELDRLTPEALRACVERFRVCARVTAEHKLGIIRAWRRRGHRVAMNGDGLNDAPALKEADIGIAMGGTGADVTREAAALVLGNDSFASIVAAVAAGRRVSENVRRLTAYLISCSAGGALALAAGVLAGLPLPLVPLQLLWVNLLSAGPTALAVGLEPHDPAVMRDPTGRRRESALGREEALRTLIECSAIATAALAAFVLAWRGSAGGEARARTMAFAVLGLATVANAFGGRHRTRSLFLVNPLSNPWLPAAAVFSVLLLAAAVQLPLLGTVLGTVPLDRAEWLRAALLALLPLLAGEIFKAWLRGRERN